MKTGFMPLTIAFSPLCRLIVELDRAAMLPGHQGVQETVALYPALAGTKSSVRQQLESVQMLAFLRQTTP